MRRWTWAIVTVVLERLLKTATMNRKCGSNPRQSSEELPSGISNAMGWAASRVVKGFCPIGG